jgi:L-seryl-tRNA(Ser) seleniumtransferase
VDRVLATEAFAPVLARAPRELVLQLVRNIQEEERETLARGEVLGWLVGVLPETLTPATGLELAGGWYAARVAERMAALERRSLRPVINATGVVLHTNLGRAPLAAAAVAAVEEVARSFSNLEYDLEAGKRGSRYDHCTELLCELTGAEAALVVNNNAAALVLALNTLAEGRGAVVSRGELVEIGGGFRVPEIMAKSGARLVEVGSTNRTHLADYEAALSESGDGSVGSSGGSRNDAAGVAVGAVLKVHRSNFRIEGFTAEVPLGELVALAGPRGIPVINDLGSGLIQDLTELGLPYEPTAAEAMRSGADLVTLSGDKLLGGPQAGIILGRAELIARLRANPLCRALRVDKLTLAALEATLKLYRDPTRARREIPVLRMLSWSAEEIGERARALATRLGGAGIAVELVPGMSMVGGGAYPGAELPTVLLAVEVPGCPAVALERDLRRGEPAVVARVERGRVVLDLRTVLEGEEAGLEKTLLEVSCGVAQ